MQTALNTHNIITKYISGSSRCKLKRLAIAHQLIRIMLAQRSLCALKFVKQLM